MPLMAAAVRSQPNTLICVLLALALDRGDGAQQGRLAGGVDRGQVRIGGDQVFGRRKGVVLDVPAVDDAGHCRCRRSAFTTSSKPFWRIFWMNEFSAPTMPSLALPPMFGHVVEEELAHRLAGRLIVDADLRLLRTVRQDRVDGDDRNAGRGRRLDGRHDAVDVDGDDHNAGDLLLDVGLDRIVLRGRVVVGVEDHQLDAGGIGRLLGALIHLVEEQRLLVDLHQRDGGLLRGGEAVPASKRRRATAPAPRTWRRRGIGSSFYAVPTAAERRGPWARQQLDGSRPGKKRSKYILTGIRHRIGSESRARQPVLLRPASAMEQAGGGDSEAQGASDIVTPSEPGGEEQRR